MNNLFAGTEEKERWRWIDYGLMVRSRAGQN
jgi:hypothetical protein